MTAAGQCDEASAQPARAPAGANATEPTEVLDRHSPEMFASLETISVVDLVCADLADALTGRDDGARVLGELAASHL